MSTIEEKVAASLGLTAEELKTQQIAASLGMTIEQMRAKQVEVAQVAALTPQELEAARRMGMTPEAYAAHRSKDAPPEEMRRQQVEILRRSAKGPITDAQKASILKAADELEASPLDEEGAW